MRTVPREPPNLRSSSLAWLALLIATGSPALSSQSGATPPDWAGTVEPAQSRQVATVTWAPGTTIFSEGAGVMPLRISCSGDDCATLTGVTVIPSGMATAGTGADCDPPLVPGKDFALPELDSNSMPFDGPGTIDYTVTICDDDVAEEDEDFTLSLRVGGVEQDSLLLQILDDDPDDPPPPGACCW